MKKATWAVVIAIIAITVIDISLTSPAEARSLLDRIFGKEEPPAGPPPEVTLKAPFPTAPTPTTTGTDNNGLANIYGTTTTADGTQENSNKMDQPHRSPEQIAEWTSGIASQAMTIIPQTWESDFGKLSANFTPYAAGEYKAYVQSVNLISTLSSHSMKLQAISDGPGIVTKEGVIGGTYHWLLQIPIMTSFYNLSMQEVDKAANFQSQNLLVQVQVGRVAPKNNTDIGLVIERWHVSAAPK